MNTILTRLALAAPLLLPLPAGAVELFTATLDGTQEVPPIVTTATGAGSLSLDGTTLELEMSWAGLSGPPTGAHIHCCSAPGANSPIRIDFFDTFPSTTSGTYVDSFDLTTDLAGISLDDFLVGLRGGLAYLNLHTAENRGGEIRGQIGAVAVAIPEPATYALMLAGLGVVGFFVARRQAATASPPRRRS